ncbi:hypothetical protein Tco_0440860, partial [Tanacetum coccineum]
NGSVTSGKGLALRAGHGGPSFEPVGCRPGDGLGTALSGAFPGRRTANSELEMELSLVGLQDAGKTSLVNSIAAATVRI